MTERKTAAEDRVIHRIRIGGREVVVGERRQESGCVRYFCACGTGAAPHATVDISAGYAGIMAVYGDQIRDAAECAGFDLASLNVPEEDKLPIEDERCIPFRGFVSLRGKVVALSPGVLPREERAAYRQLLLCTGGPGAYLPLGGADCRCTELFSGKTVRCKRREVTGLVPAARLSGWAEANLARFLRR